MNTLPLPRVALFVTCLVNTCRPSVAFAAVRLLEASGARVFVPKEQTCCGQIAYNAGDRKTATAIARNIIKLFQDFDCIVAPSGSCAAMLRHHIPLLMKDDAEQAKTFAKKCWELTDFLVNVQNFHHVLTPLTPLHNTIAYHDSCSGLRELNIHSQPRLLLEAASHTKNDNLLTPSDDHRCCGFGGSFCVTCSSVSAHMADDKIEAILKTGADRLVGGDLGCLMHLAGRMRHQNQDLRVDHIAEVLASSLDDNDTPPSPHPPHGIA